jgi:hypothetical protein
MTRVIEFPDTKSGSSSVGAGVWRMRHRAADGSKVLIATTRDGREVARAIAPEEVAEAEIARGLRWILRAVEGGARGGRPA